MNHRIHIMLAKALVADRHAAAARHNPRHPRHERVTRRPDSRPLSLVCADPRRSLFTLLSMLLVALIAGCGGGSMASGTGATAAEAESRQATEAVSEPGYETSDVPAYETPHEPAQEPPEPSEQDVEGDPDSVAEADVERASDASRWVDRRQGDVLDEVNDNNMDATKGWTP
jgi:hypothetical protein